VEELEALEKVVEEETPKNVRVSQYFRTVAAEKPASGNGGKSSYSWLKKQACGSAFISSGSSIVGWILIGIQGFNDQKQKKITAEKKIKFFFEQKTTIYLSLGLHKERPSYRRSLQLSNETIQHFKTWIF
jgi:hypothetical protein